MAADRRQQSTLNALGPGNETSAKPADLNATDTIFAAAVLDAGRRAGAWVFPSHKHSDMNFRLPPGPKEAVRNRGVVLPRYIYAMCQVQAIVAIARFCFAGWTATDLAWLNLDRAKETDWCPQDRNVVSLDFHRKGQEVLDSFEAEHLTRLLDRFCTALREDFRDQLYGTAQVPPGAYPELMPCWDLIMRGFAQFSFVSTLVYWCKSCGRVETQEPVVRVRIPWSGDDYNAAYKYEHVHGHLPPRATLGQIASLWLSELEDAHKPCCSKAMACRQVIDRLPRRLAIELPPQTASIPGGVVPKAQQRDFLASCDRNLRISYVSIHGREDALVAVFGQVKAFIVDDGHRHSKALVFPRGLQATGLDLEANLEGTLGTPRPVTYLEVQRGRHGNVQMAILGELFITCHQQQAVARA